MGNRRLTKRHIAAMASLLLLAVVLVGIAGAHAAQPAAPPAPVDYNVTTPRQSFGYDLGQDYKLTPWQTRVLQGEGLRQGAVEYMRELERTSDRVRAIEYGKTEMGKPMVLMAITSPDNWAQIENLRGILKKLADPRQVSSDDEARNLAHMGKPVVWLSAAQHATERTSPEVMLRLGYRLASGNDPATLKIVNNVITILETTINPDGLDMVTDWYYKYKDTPYVGSSPPYYNKYINHDNNRDFIGLAIAENQANVNLRFQWNPTLYFDLHQAQQLLYFTPFPDPTNPVVSPITQAEWLGYAGHALTGLIAKGYKGAFTYDYSDCWYPGYNDMFTYMHNGIGFTYELQGATYATPRVITQPGKPRSWFNPAPFSVPLTWRLVDAMNLEEDAIRLKLDYLIKNKDQLLFNFYLKGKTNMERASEGPYAFVVPANGGDNADVTDTINTLLMQRIEVQQAGTPFTAGGRQFAAGDYVIQIRQPYGQIAKNFFDTPPYPPTRVPFDVVTWELGPLHDVETVAVTETLPSSLSLVPVTYPVAYKGQLAGTVSSHYVLEHQTNNNLARALPRLFAESTMSVAQADVEFTAAGRTFPKGTFVVTTSGSQADHDKLAALAQQLGLSITAISQTVAATPLRMPRIAIYTPNNSVGGTLPEGWVRLRLEKGSEFPFTRLYPTDVGTANLADYDVIILPSVSATTLVSGTTSSSVPPELRPGIGAVGVANLKAFVEAGGILVAMGQAGLMPIRQGWDIGVTLPATAAALAAYEEPIESADYFLPAHGAPKPKDTAGAGAAAEALNAPGSLMRASVNPSVSPVGYGYDTEEAVWFDSGGGLRTPFFVPAENTTASIVASYPQTGDLLISGYLAGGDILRGKAAIVDAPLGAGHVVLLGPDTTYRGQATGTYMFFFNALLMGGRP